MSQMLLNDEIERWHDHPYLYNKKSEKFLKTPDDNDIGCFIEVGSKYPDSI